MINPTIRPKETGNKNKTIQHFTVFNNNNN